jgi:hypothetical protein
MSMKDILHTSNDPDVFYGPSSILSGHLPSQQNGIPQASPLVSLDLLDESWGWDGSPPTGQCLTHTRTLAFRGRMTDLAPLLLGLTTV